MTTRNPKQADSNLFDCKPQTGPCPIGCSQCFYNRPGAFYVDIHQPLMPDLEEVGDGIVRVNCGHDSNIGRDEVIAATAKVSAPLLQHVDPQVRFPGPGRLDRQPEGGRAKPRCHPVWASAGTDSGPNNLMFVRLRASAPTSPSSLREAYAWTTAPGAGRHHVHGLLRRTSHKSPNEVAAAVGGPCYEWRVRHINSYWCPTPAFIRYVMGLFRGNRLVSYCGSLEGPYCRLCRNCETYYLQTIKRMKGE